MTTATEQQIIESTQATCETIINDAPREFSDAEFAIPSVAHQGDLIFVRIDGKPKSAKPRKSKQLADGDTQGSRHVLEKGRAYDCDPVEVARLICEATLDRCGVNPKYIGPVITGKVCHISHPEHGDHIYHGDMVLAVVYQRSLDAEEREQRVQD